MTDGEAETVHLVPSHADEQQHDPNEEINQLRRYIMDMMHSEMEVIESIRQNEENVVTLDGRIEKFKEAIESEQYRNKNLCRLLREDQKDLQLLEDKKTVVELKHRQFQESVSAREAEVDSLRSRYACLRKHWQSLSVQRNDNERVIQELCKAEGHLNCRMREVKEKIQSLMNSISDHAELQKVRAKRRYIDEHSAHIKKDIGELDERRTKLVAESENLSSDIVRLRITIRAAEEEGERQLEVYREELRDTRAQIDRNRKKLIAKQKKFRIKCKSEHATLRRRITFVSTDLETNLMANEDILSSIFPLVEEHNQTEARQRDMETELKETEGQISDLIAQVQEIESCRGRFDTKDMQKKLSQKRQELKDMMHALRAKEDEVKQHEDNEKELKQEIARLDEVLSNQTTVELERALSAQRAKMKDLESEKHHLDELAKSLEEKNSLITTETERQQRRRKALKRELASLRKRQKQLASTCTELTTKLEIKKKLSTELASGIKLHETLQEEVYQMKQKNERERDLRTQALKEKEQCWKRECLEEETRLKAELQEWTEKVNSVKEQLAFFN
ncbi:hypothetical protein Poli38472_013095 [Pythium oligandrum]|uniref:Uncharacterized protein n=1 Tax=Pythium oligandrum TaxID=41045 RepID=A0A8K1C2G8_PYTOL|nr:hypothetical protein Poli38472_013095 [Pythium oligandrum]|eukprot:TMW55204.1 hypothetical protein Poli38472_013095 [Pythium oligandrum]